jgi:TldD protein
MPQIGLNARRKDRPVVEESVLQRVLAAALRTGGEFAEVYVEDRRTSGARLDDGKIEEFTAGRERGAGIRVVSGASTGYAHTSDLSERALTEAARAAGAAARGAEGRTTVVSLERRSGAPTHPIRELPETVEKLRKAEVLRRADDAARSAGGAIRQVSAAYADARKRVLIANSDGLLVDDDRIRTRFMVSCTALGDGGLQSGFEGPGHTVGFELFDQYNPEEVARTAAERALRMLDARPAPTGKLPVVLRQGAGGVLFHEACGHGLEADLVTRDASVFKGRIGQQVASPLVTLVDDGTFDRGWGTLSVDDEGHPASHNTLIEGGVLSDYMWDLLRARKEGRESSGNGRRETYQSLPMVRMTNTYLLAGETDPDDIIASTPYGLYCAALGGGQVNTATGDFVFGVTEAYLIENGRLTAPIRAANLIGNGPETLLAIDAVGSDFDTWAGTCGKDGQGVPVSAGQPTVRVAEVTVGGTAGA